MSFLDPQHVDEKIWRSWCIDALKLMWGNPLTILVPSVVFVCLIFTFVFNANSNIYTMAIGAGLMLMMPVYAYGWFCRSLCQADQEEIREKHLADFIFNMTKLAVFCCGSFLTLVVICTGLSFVVGTALDSIGLLPDSNPLASRNRAPVHVTYLAVLALAITFITMFIYRTCSMILDGWFVVPLMVCQNLTLTEAWRLSRLAWQRNGFVLKIAVEMIAFAGLLLASIPVFTLLYFPFIGALFYVSYRHVFLGRKDNAPILDDNKQVMQPSV